MVNATNAANAALSYAVAPNLQGSAQIRITVQDDGGTANGGSDTFTRDFIVTVTEVDDPPYLKQASETQVFLEDQFAGNANVAVVDLANVFGDPDGVAINLVLGVA